MRASSWPAWIPTCASPKPSAGSTSLRREGLSELLGGSQQSKGARITKGVLQGVGRQAPPGRVQLVRHGGLAALVSEVDLTARLGTPADLQAHAQILDAAMVEVPVLPLRFGTVMATKDAVARELLAVYQEAFAAALKEAEGRAQYVVKGQYAEQAVLTEVLAELPAAASLAKQIRGKDPDATRQARIRLGEISATRSPPSGRLTRGL